MRIKEIKIYTFAELSKEAKEKAINDHIAFLLDTTTREDASNSFKEAIDKAESMRTPWFTARYVREYCLDEIIGNLETNGFEFDENGNVE